MEKKSKHPDLHATLYTKWKQQVVDNVNWIRIVQDACHEYIRHLTPTPSSAKFGSAKESSANLAAWLEGLLLFDAENLQREKNIVKAMQDLFRDQDCLIMKRADREFVIAQLDRNGLELIRFVLDQMSQVLFQTRIDPVPLDIDSSKTAKRNSKQIEFLAEYIKKQVESLRQQRTIDKWPLVLYPIVFLIEQTNHFYSASSKVEMGIHTLALLLPLFPDTQNASTTTPVLSTARELLESVWINRDSAIPHKAKQSGCCVIY